MRNYIHEVLMLLGTDRRRLPLILFLFLCSSLVELAGIGLVGPYVAMISSPTATSDIVSKVSVWIDLPTEQNHLLIIMGLVLMSIFTIKTATSVWINYVIIRFSTDQQIRLRSILMESYMSLPYVVYLNRNSSEYIHSTQTMVADYSDGAVNTMLKTLSDVIVAIAILLFLAFANPLAFSFLVGLLAIFLFGYDTLFRKNIRRIGRMANFAATDMIQAIHEGIEGLKEVRILGVEGYFQKRVDEGANKYGNYNARSAVLSSVPRYLLEFILISFVVLLVIATILLDRKVEQLLPILGMFGVAAIRLLPAANAVSSGLMRLRFYRNSVSRLYQDLFISPHRISSIEKNYIQEEKGVFKGLLIKNIVFRYPSAENNALQELSLDIQSGESIGLIGSSGSGKTTLVDTMLGLLEPQSGEITFNGVPLKESLVEWRSHVAYLPQQVFLIDGSLRRNVALGVDDASIDEKRLSNAIKKALLSELVEQLSDGVDTVIGERGARLSGGQRQRVALARAFYHERDVLVLDEATSALDNETEREIVEEIKRLKGKKTMIVIAHRLTTVQHCDRIYKLEDGKIIALGTPQEMLGIK